MNVKSIFILAALFISSLAFSQVGVNTTSPTETLDVNGTLRIQDTQKSSIVATKVTGLDDTGVLIEIQMDDNIILQDNKLIAVNKVLRFGSISLSGSSVNDMNLLIWPGEANEEKAIIKVKHTTGSNVTITGIEAGYDGLHIILYAYDGDISLSPNNTNSAVGNRIEQSSNMSAKQYEMIELIYDAELGKWVIMQYF